MERMTTTERHHRLALPTSHARARYHRPAVGTPARCTTAQSSLAAHAANARQGVHARRRGLFRRRCVVLPACLPHGAWCAARRLHGETYSFPSDVWALGLCVIECITGASRRAGQPQPRAISHCKWECGTGLGCKWECGTGPRDLAVRRRLSLGFSSGSIDRSRRGEARRGGARRRVGLSTAAGSESANAGFGRRMDGHAACDPVYCSYYCSQTGGTSSECSRAVANAAELPFKLNGSSDFFALTHAVCNGAPLDPVRTHGWPLRSAHRSAPRSMHRRRAPPLSGTRVLAVPANPLGQLAVASGSRTASCVQARCRSRRISPPT